MYVCGTFRKNAQAILSKPTRSFLLSYSKDMALSPLSLSSISQLYRLKSLSLDSEFGRGRADTDGRFDWGLARTLRQSQSTQSTLGASAYARRSQCFMRAHQQPPPSLFLRLSNALSEPYQSLCRFPVPFLAPTHTLAGFGPQSAHCAAAKVPPRRHLKLRKRVWKRQA